MIERKLEPVIISRLFKGKAIIIIGARQTGKTTLLRKIISSFLPETLWLDADDPVVKAQLTDANISELKHLTSGYKIVVIDEAQQVKNIGKTLKLITDHVSEVQLLVSGSSALELAEENQ